jgi:hypothetical protein
MTMKSDDFLAEGSDLNHNIHNSSIHHFCSEDHEEPPPMLVRESDQGFEVNWVAILSFTTSAALSVAIWTCIFRLVAHLLK